MKQFLVRPRSGAAKSGIDKYAAERIDRNIEGMFDFLRAVIADPSIVEQIPAEAEIVLEHDIDPTLSAANRLASLKTQRAGGRVYIHRVRRRTALSAARGGRAKHRFRLAEHMQWLDRVHVVGARVRKV